MNNSYPIQYSFSSGELSPRLYGRSDAEGYRSGLQEMSNFIADSRGPAFRRGGSRYITEIAGNDGRVFGLETKEDEGYVFVLTDLKLTPINYQGIPISENYVLNPRFHSLGDNWTEDIVSGSITFLPDETLLETDVAGNAEVAIQQEVTVPDGAEEYRIAILERYFNDYDVNIGTIAGASDIFSTTVVGGGNSSSAFIPGVDTFWIEVRNSTPDQIIELGIVSVISTVVQQDFDTPWTEAELSEIHGITSRGGTTVYFCHKNHPVYKITYVYLTDSFVFEEVNFVNPPNEWADDNYPRTGVFHEGRLWFGGTPEQPQTFWGSKSGQFENFTLGSLADDAILFTLSERGDIRWMASTKNMLIGTTLSENIVSSDEGIITPSDINVVQQSAYGSSSSQPIQVGDQMFYVSADGRKLRAMQYEWSADNWLSQDITFFAEHITSSGIRHFAWAQNPDNQLICALNNGTIAGLTYERSENIFGWHKHDLSDRVVDVATARVNGEDVMMGLINRKDGFLYFELMPVNIAQKYMDSWIEVVEEDPTTTFSGLDHLEGREVQVLVEGAVHPNRTVTGGIIEIDYPANEILVGLQYISTLKTLPLDMVKDNESIKPYMKRYNRLYVEMFQSNNPLINGERQPTRFPSTPMNTADPAITGVSEVGQVGWDKSVVITIEQDLPLPCNVVSIYGELGQDVL